MDVFLLKAVFMCKIKLTKFTCTSGVNKITVANELEISSELDITHYGKMNLDY
jgi:hypothetical protein